MKDPSQPRAAAALGLTRPGLLAVAGSGGKSTLLDMLARELFNDEAPVIITTTTHINPPKAGRRDNLWLLGNQTPSPSEIDERLLFNRVLTVAGGRTLDGKLRGINPEQTAALARPGLWVLAEADGSARLPLKAWARWEPALPAKIDYLVVMAGARGLGQTIDRGWVHRPELFAQAAGVQPGDKVTPSALARVLFGPEGPFSQVVPSRGAALIINQTDAVSARDLTDLKLALENQAGARPPYQRLLGASLRWGRVGEI